MAHTSKRHKKILEMVDTTKTYTLNEAVEILKNVPPAKFDDPAFKSYKMKLATGVAKTMDDMKNVAASYSESPAGDGGNHRGYAPNWRDT